MFVNSTYSLVNRLVDYITPVTSGYILAETIIKAYLKWMNKKIYNYNPIVRKQSSRLKKNLL